MSEVLKTSRITLNDNIHDFVVNIITKEVIGTYNLLVMTKKVIVYPF